MGPLLAGGSIGCEWAPRTGKVGKTHAKCVSARNKEGTGYAVGVASKYTRCSAGSEGDTRGVALEASGGARPIRTEGDGDEALARRPEG